ncbi:hypothetical protein Vafri_17102, partial [Volvox africanus]
AVPVGGSGADGSPGASDSPGEPSGSSSSSSGPFCPPGVDLGPMRGVRVRADGVAGASVEAFTDEAALLRAAAACLSSLDPDIVLGWDVQRHSLGYLAERAAALGLAPPLLRAAGRTPGAASIKERQQDEWGLLHASGLHLTGRILLNLWRVLRGELKLGSYSFESCTAAVLGLRVPRVREQQLALWFAAGPSGGRWRCLQWLLRRCRLDLAMCEQLDLVGRTAELARTFGIDFFSVLSRGSQYRVESLLVRLAHTNNFIMPSPSREQVGGQPAMESLPLVMEPESRMYSSPVVVLDFQSLYPSMIIAYNLCYSTCVGRPNHARAAGQPVRLGVTQYSYPVGAVLPTTAATASADASSGDDGGGAAGAAAAAAVDDLIITPNGIAYVPPQVRPGVLPRMLSEILNTRVMVKGAMKKVPPEDKVLLRILNARQFGLKMIANVSYGYTAAGFSGRLPFAELADSIVQSGRQTLENAIAMVESNPEWRARVVYGDTDSMFVLLPGRSRKEAFRIGGEIAAAVTAANPTPVTLKMEKVYQPCILQTKKRYVGFAYESPGQAQPTFDAKGIETVRRDSCPAVAKMLEQSLRLLFTARDLTAVKTYLRRQWTKILSNRVSVRDFIFAKEVRLGTYSANAATIPPAAVVATKAMAADPRAEPRYAERVPYVVVHGEPGARLVDLVVSPHQLVESGGSLRLNGTYYITKQIIPALERVLSLVGADVRAWFVDMPRPLRMLPQKRPAGALPLAALGAQGAAGSGSGGLGRGGVFFPGIVGGVVGGGTIDRFYLSRHCVVCDELTRAAQPLCDQCRRDPQASLALLTAQVARLERQHAHMVRICLHCGGGGGRPMTSAAAVVRTAGATAPACELNGFNAGYGGMVCDSLDCGVYFERRKLAGELAALGALLRSVRSMWPDDTDDVEEQRGGGRGAGRGIDVGVGGGDSGGVRRGGARGAVAWRR